MNLITSCPLQRERRVLSFFSLFKEAFAVIFGSQVSPASLRPRPPLPATLRAASSSCFFLNLPVGAAPALAIEQSLLEGVPEVKVKDFGCLLRDAARRVKENRRRERGGECEVLCILVIISIV